MGAKGPDFENFRRTILRQGLPEYVPIVEFGVDYDVKAAVLGRPLRTLKDDVEFWITGGYDYVPLQTGIRTLFWPGYMVSEKTADRGLATSPDLHKHSQTRYTVYRDEVREMDWAPEGKGVITNMEEFERFPWPDPDRIDLSAFEEVKALLPPGMKALAYLGYIFTSAWWLMGMETFCFALVEQPELIRKLYDRIWSIQSRVLLRVLEYGVVAGLVHADDLAYADGLMISPKHYREYVFPWYRWACTMARERGLISIFHSDGRLFPVLDDIVGCGFNALHPIEPKAMDIVEVKKRVGDRLCLLGHIDLGYTLTRGTPEEVDAEVKQKIGAAARDGGYCVGTSNSVTAYVPLANYNAMREAAFKYGKYPIEELVHF